jgi:hypothetical protein
VATRLLAVLLVVALAGCAWAPIRTGYPWQYVVNRGGHYFVGLRCVETLVEAAAFASSSPMSQEGFDGASWHAVSNPPVVIEFELFADAQPGIVATWDGAAPPRSSALAVRVLDDQGQWHTMEVTLDQIQDAMVATGPRVISWQDFAVDSAWQYPCRGIAHD